MSPSLERAPDPAYFDQFWNRWHIDRRLFVRRDETLHLTKTLLDRLHAIDGHGQAYVLGYDQRRCRILLEKVGNFRADDKNARFLQNGLQLTQRADQSLAESHLSQSIARWSIRDSVEQEGI